MYMYKVKHTIITTWQHSFAHTLWTQSVVRDTCVATTTYCVVTNLEVGDKSEGALCSSGGLCHEMVPLVIVLTIGHVRQVDNHTTYNTVYNEKSTITTVHTCTTGASNRSRAYSS